MSNFNYQQLIDFVEQLGNLTDDICIKAFIWAANVHLNIPEYKQEITECFCTWILENQDKIKNRDESIFMLDNVQSLISHILKQIKHIWPSLPKYEQDVIWTWMDTFVLNCTN